jgi:uncharacterized protein (TIGR03083 family)
VISAQTQIEFIRSAGARIARVAPEALDATVPSCPDMTVRDLVGHTATLCNWMGKLVTTGQAQPPQFSVGSDPVASHTAELDGLIAALESADPDADGWAWGKDQHRRFWYRRAAQELVIHSWDIENTVGDALPIDPQIAADGIDEYVAEFGPSNPFFSGAAEKFEQPGARLRLVASDIGRSWTFVMGDKEIGLSDDAGADVTVDGTASELLLFLWGRVGTDSLEVGGDASLLERWQERVKI